MLTRMTLTALILVAALLTACAATGRDAAAETPDSGAPAAQPTPMPPTNDNGQMTGDVPEQLMSQIIDDAAEHAGVEPDEIEVLRAEPVTWNDGSLGCPEPGMMYTQALVDGYHVVLHAGDAELDYRVGQGGHFILCENPQDEGTPSS